MTDTELPQHLCGIPLLLRETPAHEALADDLDPVLRRILAARGVVDEGSLALDLAGLLPPRAMLNMDAAVRLLLEMLERQASIMIIADFDADGATSCALAVSALRRMGFERVSYLVPNRFEFGYGLTPEIVEVAAKEKPALLLTVDNGIASHAGVARANELGMQVLVTDHHLPADTLPAAACILNPNQHGCPFPSKSLAGVGVVFYLMSALRAALREKGWFAAQGIAEPRMLEYLDLVALGTVADVVPLDQNNRRLVKHGLRVIRSGQARPGIAALLEVANRNPPSLAASDLGFAIGPRLNAAGRLQDMSLGIECLLSNDLLQALQMAGELDELNRERKNIETDMSREALALLDALGPGATEEAGLCLYDPSWHQGVIGILASRIKERFHRPVIVFADASGETDAAGAEMLKGSARSVPGVHIRDVLDAVATRHPALLSKFGGHAMAAGLSLRREDLAAFSAAFATQVAAMADPESLRPLRFHDGKLPQQCFNIEFASLLRNTTPWGQHFPEPCFVGEFTVLQSRVLSGKHLKFVLQVPGSADIVDGILFNASEELLEKSSPQAIRALYRLDINEFRGRQSAQLLIELAEELSLSA